MKKAFLVGSSLLWLTLIASTSPVLGGTILFDFNTAGVLPSSQGATFFGSASETSVYSVSGGILHQDTLAFPSDVSAGYKVNNALDHTIDATLEWTAKKSPGGGLGVQILVAGSGLQWNFVLQDDGLYMHAAVNFERIVAMSTTDAFHNYKVLIPANSPNFDVLIDGIQRYSGVASSSSESLFEWGDSTPTGGNGKADWDAVRLLNSSSASAPEPSTVGLLGCCLLGFVGRWVVRNRKRKHVIADN